MKGSLPTESSTHCQLRIHYFSIGWQWILASHNFGRLKRRLWISRMQTTSSYGTPTSIPTFVFVFVSQVKQGWNSIWIYSTDSSRCATQYKSNAKLVQSATSFHELPVVLVLAMDGIQGFALAETAFKCFSLHVVSDSAVLHVVSDRVLIGQSQSKLPTSL